MRPLAPRGRYECLAGLAAAAIVSLSILGAVAAMFAEDGRTPWMTPGSAVAHSAEHCPGLASSSLRHECLRKVARNADAAAASARVAQAQADLAVSRSR